MITPKQAAALKWFIAKAKNGNVLTKRILIQLINASSNLTQPVSTCLTQDCQGYSAEEIRAAAKALNMTASEGALPLAEMMVLMGTDFHFSIQYGHYEDNERFNHIGDPCADGPTEMPLRYTFWLAPESCGRSGRGNNIVVSRQILDSIDISDRHGLYSSTEACRAA
jgi:hypothetical protein